jgi:uncharacterized protein
VALEFEHEFVVDSPADATWRTLLDLERVASCLPGATIEPSDDGTYPGSMRARVGPVTVDYKGTARVVEVDEAARVAVFDIRGREVRGQGSAAATIRNRLVAEGESTRVLVATHLDVTGRSAQFGRAIMEDVAVAMLDDFARSLSELMAAERHHAPSTGPPAPAEKEALELGAAVRRALRQRLARWTGLAALKRLRSRRR